MLSGAGRSRWAALPGLVLDPSLRAPIRARWLWAAGVVVGVISGYATLDVNPLLAIPLALVWLYIALWRPRLLGVGGALIGHGVDWLYLLLTSGYGCASGCWWTLAYGPAHTEDDKVWMAQTWQWMEWSAGLLILGIVLTAVVALTPVVARRLSGRRDH